MTKGPIAVGGVGGSGTRVIATILQDMGVFIGSDLPISVDTVWYAALFGRRNVFLDSPDQFNTRAKLFFEQMETPRPLNAVELADLETLAAPDRIQHVPETLRNWLESFVSHCATGKPAQRWGWKLPYTFILIDRFLAMRPDLKYVHVFRDGRDMAFSGNQNQLAHWGPTFLNRDVTVGPADSLSYWCAVDRFMGGVAARFPDRVYQLQFEHLAKDPKSQLEKLFDFLDFEATPEQLENAAAIIYPLTSIGRYKDQDMSVLRSDDLAYVDAKLAPIKQ